MNKKITLALLALIIIAGGGYLYVQKTRLFGGPIKVGILHSLTGTMAISEKSVVDATLLAIEEINQKGGVLGRKVEPVVVDGRSNPQAFADEARKLIVKEKVSVIFGCWTSTSRKSVKPVVEKYNHLLFYPVQYEGLEESPNIVYLGAAPNQQIIPAVKWAFDNLGKRFFLVGSDYVFSRTVNEIIKDLVAALGGEILGEDYLALGSADVREAVKKIDAAQPDVILNTLNGDSNIHFFNELRKAGITPEKVPTLSFSIGEEELRLIGRGPTAGDYACWSYFQSVNTVENEKFVRNFKNKYGQNLVTGDPMEAGYFGVYLWAQAVREAGTDNAREVREAIKHQAFKAPEGMVYIDYESLHTWKNVRIGKARGNGQFDIVWSSDKPIHPEPYPKYRSKTEWNRLLQGFYDSWGGDWGNRQVK